MIKKQKEEKPPESPSIVKEILCLQLAAALICGGAFAYTIVKPISVPKLDVPALDKAKKSDDAYTANLDNDKIFERIDAVPCMVLFKKGEKNKAYASALELAANKEKRKDPINLLAAGIVLQDSPKARDKWKSSVLLKKAKDMAPKSRYAALIHARQIYLQGRLADAIAEYEGVLNLSPDDWILPRLELANVYLMNEEPLKAIDMFNQVLELKPDDPRILKRLGIAMAINGDQKGGYDKFIQGSNLEYDKPDYQPEIQNLVDKYAGLIETAINEAKEAVDKSPEDIHKRITLARLLISVNRLKPAKDQLNEAKKRLEANPEIHEVLAECLYRMKDSSGAEAEFATTKRLEPLNKPAAPSDEKYLPTWEDLHEEEVLEKGDDTKTASEPAATPAPDATPAPAETPKPDATPTQPGAVSPGALPGAK